MKNQYFADTRDLFKYDLILEILLKSNLSHFAYIPMLTKNETNAHGDRIRHEKAKAGARNMVLRKFLEKCIRQNTRNINELESFFKDTFAGKFNIMIYKKNRYFSHGNRATYFNQIKRTFLSESVILVDPDIGLEVKSIKGKQEKYVKYDEVRLFCNRMDRSSILIIFQFIPRVKRKEYFLHVGKRLKRVADLPVYYISDNQVVFMILTKNMELQNLVADVIGKYGKRYNLIWGRI
jgi:hypothetical protein